MPELDRRVDKLASGGITTVVTLVAAKWKTGIEVVLSSDDNGEGVNR